jgi:hypothetical protein
MVLSWTQYQLLPYLLDWPDTFQNIRDSLQQHGRELHSEWMPSEAFESEAVHRHLLKEKTAYPLFVYRSHNMRTADIEICAQLKMNHDIVTYLTKIFSRLPDKLRKAVVRVHFNRAAIQEEHCIAHVTYTESR